jgi:hypothetical protein
MLLFETWDMMHNSLRRSVTGGKTNPCTSALGAYVFMYCAQTHVHCSLKYPTPPPRGPQPPSTPSPWGGDGGVFEAPVHMSFCTVHK